MARRQIITAGPRNQAVDISIPAVKTVMDIYGVEDQVNVLLRVVNLWRYVEASK